MSVQSVLEQRLRRKVRSQITLANLSAEMTVGERTALETAIQKGRSREGMRILNSVSDRWVRNQASTRATQMLSDNSLSQAELAELFA